MAKKTGNARSRKTSSSDTSSSNSRNTPLNKYNIRAIRKELDNCIRSGSWNRFRTTLASIENDIDTCRALVELRPPLLQELCSNKNDKSAPKDIVEQLLQTVPSSIYLTHRGASPLHVCIARDAAPQLIDCLLHHDHDQQQQQKYDDSSDTNHPPPRPRLLYMLDTNGDTPLLLAVRSYSQRFIIDDVVQRLVHYDRPTKQSLLVQSRRHHKTALWYMAKQELRGYHDAGNVAQVPPILAWMLQQTYEALQIREGAFIPSPITTTKLFSTSESLVHDTSTTPSSNVGLDTDKNAQSEFLVLTSLVQATLACSELLDDKYASKLLGLLLHQEPLIDSTEWLSSPVDNQGNLMLHWSCAHFQYCGVAMPEGIGGFAGASWCDYLVQRHPEAARQPNNNHEKQLPLHLLLSAGFPSCSVSWERHQAIVNVLIQANPEALKTPNGRGELPLHLALKQHMSLDWRLELARQLWQLCPETALWRDSTTGLFPFQLATFIATEQRVDEGAASDDDPALLDFCYFLLRQSPQVLRHFLG